jgi:hypothetical protein
MSLNARRDEITLDQLITEMAGGSELTALARQLARDTRANDELTTRGPAAS